MNRLAALLNLLLANSSGQAILGIILAKYKRLCAELVWMAHRDQQARQRWEQPHQPRTVHDLEQLIRIDLSNTQRLKRAVAKYGWPGERLVGPIGAQAAWLLAQHADHDTAFQKLSLGLLREAVKHQDAPAAHLAYLTDRVRVAEGQRQIYGTQFHGNLQPLPIKDEARLDERRAQVGLSPLVEYIQQMHQARAQQRAWSEHRAELLQLLSELPPTVEYVPYLTHLKRLLEKSDPT